VLLDLDAGSLLFFKNGVQHGTGFPAGSVTGPVVVAARMAEKGQSVRLHSGVGFPIEATQTQATRKKHPQALNTTPKCAGRRAIYVDAKAL
jgi:hypothetical protein